MAAGLRLVYVMACVLCGLAESQSIIDVNEFTEKLMDVARDALGQENIQELMDTQAQFNTRVITADMGAQLANELQTSLNTRFADYFAALERITVAATDAYVAGKFPERRRTGYSGVDYEECCRVDRWDLEYDPRFFDQADTRSSCYRVSKDAPDVYTSPAVEELGQVFAQNFLDHDNIKWQYFGTEEGVLLLAPKSVASKCDDYDPRFRPWYAESSSPIPKDIVLVIDSSGSMRGYRMEIAKAAAVTVVGTLNPNDRVNVVRFSSEASTAPGSYSQSLCYADHMAYALPANVRYIKSYINNIQYGGQTVYLPALEEAFRLLTNADDIDGQTRDKVILFLTDGEPTDAGKEEILAKIRELNSALDNAVTIMTYGLRIIMEEHIDLLQAMANQEGSDSSKGDAKVGEFTKIDNEENLRYDLGSYYSHFSQQGALEKPSISVPYIDFFGLGLVTSICDTVLHGDELKGVACIDVRIADILGDLEYAQPGALSYSFIIDRTGRTLIHPLLPSPFKVEDDPIFLDISVLERAPQAQRVIDSMKRGESGAMSFMSDFTVSMGLSKQHGVEVINRQATFLWRPIANTELSFCLVFATEDKEVSISVTGNTEHFLFHRFDLVEPEELCNHAGRLSSKEHSAVAFGDQAYADVRLKDSVTLTKEDIDKMANYMATTGYRWEVLQKGVKDSIVVTEQMDEFWKASNEEFSRYVSSSFIGLENGMFRVYPGISLPINYDHQERTWYNDALANRDKLVLTVPYLDAFGAGIITTIGHSILEGKPVHSSEDRVIGVIAADFSVAYFENLIKDTYSKCKNGNYVCFLMDESGYLIIHPELDDGKKADANRHIVGQEPEIASVLIELEFLRRERCVSLGENKQWLTWTVSSHDPVKHKASWLGFELHWVAGSNVFLGAKDASSDRRAASCKCKGTATDEFKCASSDERNCECPCYAPAQYDYCSNTFLKESLPEKTCTPPREAKHYESPLSDEDDRAAKAPPCFDVGFINGGGSDSPNKDTLSGGAIAGIVCGIFAFVIILALMLIYCC